MNQRSILLICALLAAASSLATCQNRIDFKYVDFSSLMIDRHFAIKAEETNQVLILLGNFPPADLPSTLNMYHENILYIKRLEGLTTHQSRILRHLWILGKREMGNESFAGLIKSLMYVCYKFSTTEYPNLIMFEHYLWMNAQHIFADYLPGSVEALSLPGTTTNQMALDLLELAFGVQSTETRPLTIEQKLEALKNFDMRNYNRDRGTRLGETVTIGRGEPPLDRFFLAVYHHCKFLRSDREHHFNVVSLARSFGVTQDNMSIQAEILMEINRLCASTAADHIRDAIRGN